MKINENANELSPELLKAVTGGAEVLPPDSGPGDPKNPEDPHWTQIDYPCPKCGEKLFRWICPGTASELLCRKCGWQTWF